MFFNRAEPSSIETNPRAPLGTKSVIVSERLALRSATDGWSHWAMPA